MTPILEEAMHLCTSTKKDGQDEVRVVSMVRYARRM